MLTLRLLMSWYDYENNQQDALYRLIYYSKSALHVSGDVFAHNQEHLTVFTVSGNVHPVALCWCPGWVETGLCGLWGVYTRLTIHIVQYLGSVSEVLHQMPKVSIIEQKYELQVNTYVFAKKYIRFWRFRVWCQNRGKQKNLFTNINNGTLNILK